jgi:hypothetical protein
LNEKLKKYAEAQTSYIEQFCKLPPTPPHKDYLHPTQSEQCQSK